MEYKIANTKKGKSFIVKSRKLRNSLNEDLCKKRNVHNFKIRITPEMKLNNMRFSI